ncbi:MAG: beta-ketoacyl-ACP synthase II [Oscillospiraceae bacterium]|uniref:3-oxoacyl-[acyl-carrier-protein] synthase 2 n=1 Tax=Caproicibacterium lactatifermentans TaxID=2666138 RepID=A0A859DPW7_9FIRM|nr:beta-ketoacyl-ACP synthase II [Caproicibacterium lactatifermentans]MDD4807987.1 beta-ketoacyl-ACP synthase II [Oscillospiraceae bacterium]QKN23888.1 beta-ketoacyl-ACP synthase II [Caproicibacterium lactatifermentans]
MRRVAVTGLGAVTPLGNTTDETWKNLTEGKNGIGRITHFDSSDLKVYLAGEVKGFDPLQYFSRSELRKYDLFIQYAVAATEQAMEDSGIKGKISPERLGIYIGSGIGGISTTLENYKRLLNGKHVSAHMITSMIVNMAAGVVSIRTGAKGPCVPIVTACATSTHTIGEAFHCIRDGYADAAIAGGSEAAINPLTVAGFSSCMALTTNPDANTACRPFDKNRSGFVLGEGAGILLLEEYEHAKARGAKIYGEVLGYANTSDAYHITAPQPEAEGITRCIQLAVKEAGVNVGSNTYINAHGTSTVLNDKSETLAFKQAFGEETAHQVKISSTKSMTGHLLGATGAVEALACLKALQTGTVPPTIGLTEPDPDCDLNYTPGKAMKADLKTAISTSLGFGGHNGCLVFGKAEEE